MAQLRQHLGRQLARRVAAAREIGGGVGGFEIAPALHRPAAAGHGLDQLGVEDNGAALIHPVPGKALEGGLKEGIKLGWRFEINRLGAMTSPGDPRIPEKIALAEFDKYMGQEKTLTLLRIIEGDTKNIRRTDEAVAIRRLTAVSPAGPEAVNKPSADRSRPGNIYKITGRTGTEDNSGHIINYGSNDGARHTDVLWVYKNNEYKARLRLDQVEKTFSVGFVIDGSQVAPPDEEDEIYTREPRKIVFGKVALVDKIKGIAVDVNKRHGARSGQRFQVRREGKMVGTIALTNVQTWGSWARLESGTRITDIQKGDIVELID